MTRSLHTLALITLIPALGAAQTLQFGPPAAPAPAANTAPAVPLDSIGLIVNQEAISKTQLAQELQAAAAQLPPDMRNAPEAQQLLLERVIMQHLTAQLAQRLGIKVNSQDIDQAIAHLAQQNGISEKTLYERAQKDTGMNRAVFRNSIQQQIAFAKLREEAVGGSVRITPQQIDDQIAQIARQRGTTLHLQDLLIPIPDLPIEQRGQAIVADMTKLSDALKANSNDLTAAAAAIPGAKVNDLGNVNLAEIPPRFARAVASLNSGQMTIMPVSDADGMHFLKVVSKTSADSANNYIVPEARLEHILIRRDSNNPQQAKREIDRIYGLLQQGANFEDLARRYSQDPGSASKGGDLGWMSADSVDPRFAQQLETVPLNQISAPFESAFGWHIIRVFERRSIDRSEDRIREQIRESLYQSALQNAWEQQLLEIRQNAYIDIRL